MITDHRREYNIYIYVDLGLTKCIVLPMLVTITNDVTNMMATCLPHLPTCLPFTAEGNMLMFHVLSNLLDLGLRGVLEGWGCPVYVVYLSLRV